MAERWTFEGIDLVLGILGLIGACLGVASMPKMTRTQLAAAIVAGVATAVLFTPVVDATYKALAPDWMNHDRGSLPGVLNNALAFFFGIGGMFVVPGIIVFWRTVGKNPFAVIDWLRGKAPAPPPDDDAHSTEKP